MPVYRDHRKHEDDWAGAGTRHLSAEEYVQSVHDEVKRMMEKHNLKIEFSDKH